MTNEREKEAWMPSDEQIMDWLDNEPGTTLGIVRTLIRSAALDRAIEELVEAFWKPADQRRDFINARIAALRAEKEEMGK